MHHVHRSVLAAKVGYAILIPALITALAALAAPIAVAADAPSLKRGDEFILFRDTRVELPGGKSRTLSRGTRGRVIEVQGPQVIAIVDGAKLPVAADNIVSGRSGVARISAEIRARPDDWLNYLIRADLRRQFKDYDEALKDIAAVPEDAAEYANALFYRGLIHSDQEHWQPAADDFTKAVGLVRRYGVRRRTASILMYRGRAYCSLGKLDEALTDLDEAIKGGRENAFAYYWRAWAQQKKGDAAEAVESLTKAKQLDPYELEIRSALLRIYKKLDLVDLALAEVNEYLEMDQDNLDFLVERARLLIDRKELDAATKDIDRVLAAEPRHAGALIFRAIVVYTENDRDKLRSVCDELEAVELKDAPSLVSRAYFLMACERNSRAMDDLSRAIELGTRDHRAFMWRAALLTYSQQWEKAKHDANEAIKLDPRNYEAYYLRGLSAAETNDNEAAISDLNRVIHLNPYCLEAYEARADVLARQRHFKQAIADLYSALALAPGEIKVAGRLIQLLSAERRFQEAIIVSSEQIVHGNQSPPTADDYAFRAMLWTKAGSRAMAIADLSEAIRLRRDDPMLWYQRSGAYLNDGKLELSLSDLGMAEKLGLPEAHLRSQRAFVRARMGEYDEAAFEFRTLLSTIDDREGKAFCYGGLAWIAATAHDDRVRDAKKALENAKEACELTAWRAPPYLGAYAAALAEAGDYAKAVEWQSKAIALASGTELEKMRERLDLYKANRPFRQTPLRVPDVAARK